MAGQASFSHVPFYLNSIIVLSLVFSFDTHRNLFMALWAIYGILPVLDAIIPSDLSNPSKDESKILATQFKWKLPIYIFIVTEWISMFKIFYLIIKYPSNWSYFIVGCISSGHLFAISFLFSHELIHKNNKFDQFLGMFNMVKNLYMHFYLEHLFGHHKYVATPADPATAKLNQSLYSFLYQTCVGSFKNSWNREVKRLKKRNLSVFSYRNRALMFILCEVSFVWFIYAVFGRFILLSFLGQALSSIFILETINYIRHYGLMRKEISKGVYEETNVLHSWNAPQRVQNMVFLNLQRHSDHHANSNKPYQCLLSLDESPTLPGGYLGMIPAAMIPPVWFYIMNNLVNEFNNSRTPTTEHYKQSRFRYNIMLFLQASFFTLLYFLEGRNLGKLLV